MDEINPCFVASTQQTHKWNWKYMCHMHEAMSLLANNDPKLVILFPSHQHINLNMEVAAWCPCVFTMSTWRRRKGNLCCEGSSSGASNPHELLFNLKNHILPMNEAVVLWDWIPNFGSFLYQPLCYHYLSSEQERWYCEY